jgi:hypothetical protein
MRNYKGALGFTMLGTGAAVLIAQPFAFADDPVSDPIEVPGFSFNATVTGAASLTASMHFAITDTILEGREYPAAFQQRETRAELSDAGSKDLITDWFSRLA